ncbi:MAG: c-type cytochrome [Gammaproteobacteria bacterium]
MRPTATVAAGAALVLSGCGMGALAPAGAEAQRLATLFWWMAAGAAVIWVTVLTLAIHAARSPPFRDRVRTHFWLVAVGGAAVPTLLLGVLLLFTLRTMTATPAAGDGVRVDVLGERWWWRVRYTGPDGTAFELANELHLPVGGRVELRLTSDNVIHSFWVPALAGKIDLIPGRVTHKLLEPTRAGVHRGYCAEYCGPAHALMKLVAVVQPRALFERWLAGQVRPRHPPQDELARAGEQHFLANGCGGCHTVRGTPADGRIGPDLTHLASRRTLGAGTLPLDRESLQRWIAQPRAYKPSVEMPGYHMLPAQTRDAIAAYLLGLS